MNNLQVEYFIRLCETLSFTKTAKSFFVSQPAISKQISSFEKELGIILFDRTNRNVTLTPSGKLFYKFFSEMSDDFQKTLANAKKLSGIDKETIVVGFLEGWNLSSFLPYISNSLGSDLSNISFNFISCSFKDLIEKLESGEIDLAFGLSDNFNNTSNINIKELTSIHSLLFYSAGHPLASKPNLKFEDFRDSTFIVFSHQSINTKSRILEICKPFNFIPKISTVPNIESMIIHVESGLGVAIFDEWIRYKHSPILRYIQTGTQHKVIIAWKKHNSNHIINKFINEISFLLNNL